MTTGHGRAIRIFLVEGRPTGIRTVEVGNWTIKALVAPRAELAKLRERPEAGRPGVYFLLGEDPDDPGRLRVYVGESDDAVARQDAHARQKEFWDTVVVFISQDDRLTKAHVRWLEAELLRRVGEARRARLDNTQNPDARSLPEADTAEMREFVDQVILVAEVLGLGIFPYSGWGTRSASPADSPASVLIPIVPGIPSLSAEGRQYRAYARLTPDGFVVLKGSVAAPTMQPSVQKGYSEIRAHLISEGVLSQSSSGELTFQQDYVFRGGSAAACVVSGSSRNGRSFWKLDDGRTLGEWEDGTITEPSEPVA